MAYMAPTSLTRQLGTLFEGGCSAGVSDRQLLERFMNGRDEAAFAAIVARHGPMVLNVCWQLLGDRHHAEDAFQAVFLVLARKAPSLREPDLLGNWLYGVALRTARKARGRLARRRRTEEHGAAGRPEALPAVTSEPMLDREQAEALHGEINRLPGAFRVPVVLCYFEGLSLDEAAHRLRWPVGTLRSRLARARDKLRRGLSRRGFVLSTAALAPRPALTPVSSLLCDSTTRAAIAFAFAARHAAVGGALSAPAATLAQEVLRTMLIHKLKLVVMTVLALAAITTGAGYLAHSLNASALSLPRKSEPPGEPRAQTARTEPRPPEQRMTVTGRVLDPKGKPVAGAAVDLVARWRTPRVGTSDEGDYALLAQGRTDAEGRYRLDAPRTASTRVFEVHTLAAAPGYGLGWAELNPDAERPDAEITLPPEQLARARLVDVTGSPARGVEVRVSGVWRPNIKNEGKADGVSVGVIPPEGLRAWPKPVKTDDQGRIDVPGIGRGVNVSLQVRDLRYARQGLTIDAASAIAGKEATRALEPARLIEGRVLAENAGSPIPNAIVSVQFLVKHGNAYGFSNIRFRADDQGRFVLNLPASEHYTLSAIPSGGEPYISGQVEFQWTKGTVKANRDITMRRGIAIRGKVTEQGTGRPLAGSSIQQIAVRGRDVTMWGSGSIVASHDDGSFELAVPPSKGHLIIFGPTPDYILGEIGSNRLHEDRPGGARTRAHAIIPYEVKAGGPPVAVNAVLRPGVTLKGRVEGPGGETVADAFILTTLHADADRPTWDGQSRVPVRDGRFELHGLDPEGSARIAILDPEHQWGAMLEVSGKQAGQELTIRLERCGAARARFVGPDGKPIAGHWPMVEFIATPGPSEHSMDPRDRAELLADAEILVNLDRKHYWPQSKTDAEGRITLPDLIPGALYRITDFSTANDHAKGPRVRKDFTVKPGETLDLGDIVIQKP